jgi:hypothetical protein
VTSDVIVDRSRTAAATAARQRRAARRVALDLAARLDLVEDEVLATLTARLVAECMKRGVVEVEELFIE